MKKTINLICVAILFTSILSCGDKKNEQEAIVAPQGMNVLDLSKYGKPFAIFIPDTSAAKLSIIQQTYGALDIRVGNNFALSINEATEDIELKKKDISEDEINKFKNYVVQEAGAIFWESEITKPEFHFIMNQKIGNTDYSFQEIKTADAEPFGKEAIQKMFDSAKNIKEIKKEPVS